MSIEGSLDEWLREHRGAPKPPPDDLTCLRGWAKRLDAWLNDDPPPNRHVSMIFLPDRMSRNAMMRLSIQYPHVIKQIEDMVDFARKWFDRFRDDETDEVAWANLTEGMMTLSDRIKTGVSIVEQEQGKGTLSALEPPATTDGATHSPDFTSVVWFGTRYTFSKGNQAQAVRLLWEAWESGGHSLIQETIGKRIDSAADRFELAKTFRRRKPGGGYESHPAWGTMIQQDSKGSYRLVPSESA